MLVLYQFILLLLGQGIESQPFHLPIDLIHNPCAQDNLVLAGVEEGSLDHPYFLKLLFVNPFLILYYQSESCGAVGG